MGGGNCGGAGGVYQLVGGRWGEGGKYLSLHVYMRGSREGVGGVEGVRTSPEICKADITGNEKKIDFFSYLCTSTVIRQSCPPPRKNVLDPRLLFIDKLQIPVVIL